MRTTVFHVRRVLTATGSPVARLEAVDANGHELRLEVPTLALEGAAPGHLLVLQWSVHDAPRVAEDAPAPTTTSRPDPAAVDQEFMTLMARGRSTTAAQGRSIDKELNNLLGTAEAKGPK